MEKNNILYIDMSTSNFWEDHFMSVLLKYKSLTTEVRVVHLEAPDVPFSPFLPTQPYYYNSLLKTIAEAELKGFDAVIIGCAVEPGLRVARQLVRIPVVGPFSAALHVFGLLGKKFAVLCPAQRGKRRIPITWYEETMRMSGFLPNQAVFRLVEVNKPQPSEIERFVSEGAEAALRDEILQRYQEAIYGSGIEQARLAVEEDGADVVFFACTLWGGMLASVAEAISVPVLDPIATPLAVAECLVKATKASKPVRSRKGGI